MPYVYLKALQRTIENVLPIEERENIVARRAVRCSLEEQIVYPEVAMAEHRWQTEFFGPLQQGISSEFWRRNMLELLDEWLQC